MSSRSSHQECSAVAYRRKDTAPLAPFGRRAFGDAAVAFSVAPSSAPCAALRAGAFGADPSSCDSSTRAPLGTSGGRAFGFAVGTRAAAATAAKIEKEDGGASGTVRFKYKTSGTTSGGNPIVIMFPGPIQFTSDLCVAFTSEHVEVCSVFFT